MPYACPAKGGNQEAGKGNSPQKGHSSGSLEGGQSRLLELSCEAKNQKVLSSI